MNGTLTYREYQDAIDSMAKECAEGLASGEIDDAYDWIHESVDSHQYVIYTAYAFDVLKHSSNWLAYDDEVGTGGERDDLPTMLCQYVYWAMAADVSDAMPEPVA